MKPKRLGPTLGWKTNSSKLLFESKWYNLRQDSVNFKSKNFTYTYVEHPGSVFVVPITENNEIVLLRTYRHTADDWCWEVPAGGIGDRANKTLEEVARAEMLEEAGCSGGELENLGSFYAANGVMDSRATYFLARDVALAKPRPEETELIDRIALIPIKDALSEVQSGRINDGESAFAIMLALARLSHFTD